MQEINWNLIHRCLSGEANAAEKQELDRWIESDIEHKKLYEELRELWNVQPADEIEVDFSEEWSRMERRLGISLDQKTEAGKAADVEPGSSRIYTMLNTGKSRGSSWQLFIRIAAIILIIALPATYLITQQIGDAESESLSAETEFQTIQTDKGERASMVFSDGSRVVLNAMTTVRFPRQFAGDKREIELEGEAFFDIKHREGIPFIVHSSDVSVQVLGTEFNVNSYGDRDFIEVVVREGSVAVRQNNPDMDSVEEDDQVADENRSEVVLAKGERTRVAVGQFPTPPEQVSLAPYLAWVNGMMTFEGAPLNEVVRRLNLYYDMEFEVADSSLLEKRLTASFQREQLDRVLQIITFSLDIDYEQQGDTILFKPTNNGERDE